MSDEALPEIEAENSTLAKILEDFGIDVHLSPGEFPKSALVLVDCVDADDNKILHFTYSDNLAPWDRAGLLRWQAHIEMNQPKGYDCEEDDDDLA